MDSSKSNKTDGELLGSDLFWEICSRMPAKAAIKLSSLSKTLTGLLSDPLFVDRQCIRSSLFDGSVFLLSPQNPKSLEFHVLPNSSTSFGIPGKSLSFLQQVGPVLDSSQGLVLVKSESDLLGPRRFLICNPATGSCALLPLPDMPHLQSKVVISSGLLLECRPRDLETTCPGGSDYFPNDYTIIAPFYRDHDSVTDFAVYRNGKWDQDPCYIGIKGHQLCTGRPAVALFRGCDSRLVVHYLCDSEEDMDGLFKRPFMVAIDFERKALSRIFPLPMYAWDSAEDCNVGSLLMTIFKWRSTRLGGGETVGLMRTDQGLFRVWVLEDYDTGRWRRVVRKPVKEMAHKGDSIVLSCCVVNGTHFLFTTRSRVYAYELDASDDASRITVLAEHGRRWDRGGLAIIPYANTLRPFCDFGLMDKARFVLYSDSAVPILYY